MAKDLVKEGMTFALGLVKISGKRFNKVIKGLEKRNKVSSNEGEKMVYRWLSEQQKQLEKMRKQIKREALRTRVYSAKDLAALNRVVKKLSKEIAGLEKKKKKTEKQAKKRKKKTLRKRTAKKKTKRRSTRKKRKR
jgi:polyhydroxyalkanoate synthesis regulator phasin